jgi:hypothetical protein
MRTCRSFPTCAGEFQTPPTGTSLSGGGGARAGVLAPEASFAEASNRGDLMHSTSLAVVTILFLICGVQQAAAQRASSGATSSRATVAPTVRSGTTSPTLGTLGSTGVPASPSTPGTSATGRQDAPPAPTIAPIAPLSPSISNQFSSGGTVQGRGNTGSSGSLALSPGVSPSQSAPSQPGGGGKSLQDCMGFWDRDTHMTKAEWRAACRRTMQEYPTIR